MKFNILIFIAFILTLTATAFSQTVPVKTDRFVQGKVFELESGLPLAYASVGLLNRPFGSLTDSSGGFNFTALETSAADTLQISLVGYFSQKMALTDFTDGRDRVIRLNKKIIELPTFIVANVKTNIETIGRQGSGKMVQVSAHKKKSAEETVGSEMGMKYKTAHLGATLKDFNFYLSVNNFNTIKFRVNIYSVKNGTPDTLLYNRQIFATVDNFKTGWTKLDLAPYQIKVPKEFILTLQWVEGKMDKKENPLTVLPVALTLFSKNCYVRMASQDKWKKMGVNLSNYVNLAY